MTDIDTLRQQAAAFHEELDAANAALADAQAGVQQEARRLAVAALEPAVAKADRALADAELAAASSAIRAEREQQARALVEQRLALAPELDRTLAELAALWARFVALSEELAAYEDLHHFDRSVLAFAFRLEAAIAAASPDLARVLDRRTTIAEPFAASERGLWADFLRNC